MAGSRKLGRTSDHRKAMLRAMVTYLLENGRIETTVYRAKEVRSMAEKMITLGKDNSLHCKRQIYSYITKETDGSWSYRIGGKWSDTDGSGTKTLYWSKDSADPANGTWDMRFWNAVSGPDGPCGLLDAAWLEF